jgi:hypothetical protein
VTTAAIVPIIALLIVVVWTGAAFSKFGRHFANVIPPMVSNTPWMLVKAIKCAHYRDFPRDLRPSERAVGVAHVGGTSSRWPCRSCCFSRTIRPSPRSPSGS